MNLNDLQAAGRASLDPSKIKITVGMATCGLAAGADAVFDTLQQRLQQRGLDAALTKTGCLGCCHQEPIVEVRLPPAGSAPLLYTKMTRVRARALVDELAHG